MVVGPRGGRREGGDRDMIEPKDQKKYDLARVLVIAEQRASATFLQSGLKVGYNTAKRLIEELEANGVIGPYDGVNQREVLEKEQPKAKRSKTTQSKADKPTGKQKTAAKAKTAASDKKPAEKRTRADRKGIGGRPQAWIELEMEHKLDSVTGWMKQGATVSEISQMLGVSEETFYKWQREIPEFKQAIRAGRYVADGELLAAAFRQSVGFTAKQRKAFKVKSYEVFKDPATGKEELLQVEKLETAEEDVFIAPNAQMAMFMLANRMPEEYKRQHNVKHEGMTAGSLWAHMTDEELEAEAKKYAAMVEPDQNEGVTLQ